MSGEEERKARILAGIAKMHESSLVQEEQPQFVGEGADRVVFALKSHTKEGEPKEGEKQPHSRVAKVDKHTLVAALRENIANGRPYTYYSAEQAEKLRAHSREIYESLNRMREFFGDAVLPEKVTIRHVPITDELLEEVAVGDPDRPHIPPGTHEVVALVTLQRRAPKEAMRPPQLEVISRYLERPRKDEEEMSPAVYEAINRACVDHPESMECRKYIGEVTRNLGPFASAAHNEKVRATLTAFVRQAIRYTQSTGDQLDLAGMGNARLYKDASGDWKCVIIDGRYDPGTYRAAGEALEKMARGEEISRDEKSNILNALAYTRYLNAAASVLGIEERLHISKTSVAKLSKTLFNELKRKS